MRKIIFKEVENKAYWIMWALFFKGILFLLQLMSHGSIGNLYSGFIGNRMSDTASYFDPIENLLKSGVYTPDFRMPGYGAVYYLLRLFFSQNAACNTIIFLQYILASISVYYMALLAMEVLKNKKAFYITFFLFLISPYSNYYDTALLTEAFCTAAIVFGTYSFIRYTKKDNYINIFLCGIFITWAVFLRPIYIFLLPAFSVILILNLGLKKFKYSLKSIIILLIPFIVIDGSWILRNYRAHKTINPLTTYWTPAYRQASPAILFVKAWGGTQLPYIRSSAVCWFGYSIVSEYSDTAELNKVQITKDIPQALEGVLGHNYLYTSAFNYDSLLVLKTLVIQQQSLPKSDSVEIDKLQDIIAEKFYRYRISVQREKPYLFYYKARMAYFKMLITPTQGEAINYSKYDKGIIFVLNRVIKILGLKKLNNMRPVFYYLLLYLCFIALPILIYKAVKGDVLLLLIIVPVLNIIIPSFVFNLDENRYMMPQWPFIIGCAGYIILVIYQKLSGLIHNKKEAIN